MKHTKALVSLQHSPASGMLLGRAECSLSPAGELLVSSDTTGQAQLTPDQTRHLLQFLQDNLSNQ